MKKKLCPPVDNLKLAYDPLTVNWIVF